MFVHMPYFAIFIIIVCVFVSVKGDGFQHTLGHIKPQVSTETQEEAAFEVIKRIVPERANSFRVIVDPDLNPEGKDTFEVKKENDTIVIKGTTGVAVTTGFHYYLKYYCFAHISWEANQLNLPEICPDVDVKITLNDRFRYYQNVCTTSYSFVWWDWKQWERHIDWMALNSFNLVLAFNGQEAIWERVYRKLNLTQADIDEHFTGPAFLSWLRMGNIRGWGGPLSSAWHNRSITLQKKILQRMRSLGMIPVLPAFAGHLPRAFKRIYPNINMTLTQRWNDFNDTYCCPYFLDPTEKFFKIVGKMFMQEQIAEFGTDHVYNCDSFNEVDPSTSDLAYLANVGKNIYAAMTDVDPKAVWVMQGWLFFTSTYWEDTNRIRSFVTSVPVICETLSKVVEGKMIILDLQSEQFPQYDRLEQYFGQPYIWCMLHDFGGTLGMFGSVNIINQNVVKARRAPNSTMIGTGLTPEGINQNYVVYDLMTESAWRTEPSDLDEWFKDYTLRRYGHSNEAINKAWQLLTRSVYDYNGLFKLRGRYAITNTPNLKLDIWTWYSYDDVLNAWDNFIEAAEDFKNRSAFLHDLVDVTRQCLQINGDIYYQKLIGAFSNKDISEFENAARIFLTIFDDLELILSTNKAFLLGPWLESAKACASNEEEEKQFEYNARNQITLWGPSGEIINYANKQWSGIIGHYFQPRWKFFISSMNESLQANIKFNEKKVRERMFNEVEEPFTFERNKFPTEGTGDTIEIANDIHNRWRRTSRSERSKKLRRETSEEMLAYFERWNNYPKIIVT